MKQLIFNKIKLNKSFILIIICIAPFYLIFGCPLRFLFGICCPGCGMSRALWHLLCLDFGQAAYMHPLVFLLPVAAIVWLFRKKIPGKIMAALCVTALVLLFTVYVIRLANGSEVVYWDFARGALYRLFHRIVN